MLNSRNSFQSEMLGRGDIDLASWFLERGEAKSAEDKETGEDCEEDEAGEEAVGGEEKAVDKAGF